MFDNLFMNATTYTDTLIYSVKLVGGDTFAQVFVNHFDDFTLYPVEHQRDTTVALRKHLCYQSVPNHIHTNKN